MGMVIWNPMDSLFIDALIPAAKLNYAPMNSLTHPAPDLQY